MIELGCSQLWCDRKFKRNSSVPERVRMNAASPDRLAKLTGVPQSPRFFRLIKLKLIANPFRQLRVGGRNRGARRDRPETYRPEKENGEGRFYFWPSGFPFLSTAFPSVVLWRGIRGWFSLTLVFLLVMVSQYSTCTGTGESKESQKERKKSILRAFLRWTAGRVSGYQRSASCAAFI